jgi:hypothetical protein
MELNPYEAPGETYAQGQSQKASVALRTFAVIAWVASPLPIVVFFVAIWPQDWNLIWERSGLLIPTMCGLMCFLPPVGLALIGAACWGRVRWMGIVGLAALVPLLAEFIRKLIYELF